jgi:hypothetical protein
MIQRGSALFFDGFLNQLDLNQSNKDNIFKETRKAKKGLKKHLPVLNLYLNVTDPADQC